MQPALKARRNHRIRRIPTQHRQWQRQRARSAGDRRRREGRGELPAFEDGGAVAGGDGCDVEGWGGGCGEDLRCGEGGGEDEED